jgi:ferredoxin-thioredoxin reductase catalytic subunit
VSGELVVAGRVYLIPAKGLLGNAEEIILGKLNGGELKYVKDVEIPCTRPMLIELVVDDDCEICPYAIELVGEMIAKCDKVTAKIYNITYVKEPFEVSGTPAFMVNGVVKWTGIPLGNMKLLEDKLIDAYIRSHPELNNLIARLKGFADQHGFKRNPNNRAFMRLIYRLLLNIDKYGYPYCPCRPLKVAGTTQETYELNKDKVCPCTYATSDVKLNGRCLCGLFWSGREVDRYIDERLKKYGWIVDELRKIVEEISRNNFEEIGSRIIVGGSREYVESIIRMLEKIYAYLPED